jgi:hypothetical protein
MLLRGCSRRWLMSHHWNAEQNHAIKITNRCIENVAKLKYLRTTLTNQNCIYEEFKSRLNFWNSCCQSLQNLLSSHLLSKNIKIKASEILILPCVLYGCETS